MSRKPLTRGVHDRSHPGTGASVLFLWSWSNLRIIAGFHDPVQQDWAIIPQIETPLLALDTPDTV